MLAWVLISTLANAGCEPSTSGPSVEVMTFNTWGLPAPIAASRRARFPSIRTFLAGEAGDVAALQEVWSGARRLLGIQSVHYPQTRGDSGLALASPHPVTDVQAWTFSAATGFDALKRKGALAASVDVPDVGRVPVVVTHLQSGHAAKAAAVRATQVDELLAWVADLAGPVVLLGDFNFYHASGRDTASHQQLRDAGFVDIAASVGEERGTYPGVNDRYDRVYVRGESADGRCVVPVGAEVLDEAGLSDHRPVRARFRVTDAVAAVTE